MQIIDKKTPEIGESLTLMERLKRYIEPVDKKWSQRIKSADVKDIFKLRKFLGMEEVNLDFPKAFIEFSKYAGEDDGGLFKDTLKASLSISTLIDMYEEIYLNEKECLNPQYFEFLFDENGLSYGMNLGDKQKDEIFLEEEYKISSSFEKLVFQCAVHLYQEKYYVHNFFIGVTKNEIDNALNRYNAQTLFEIMNDIIVKYGLQESWLNEDVFLFAYSNDVAFLLEKKVAVSIIVMGDDEKKVAELREDILLRLK